MPMIINTIKKGVKNILHRNIRPCLAGLEERLAPSRTRAGSGERPLLLMVLMVPLLLSCSSEWDDHYGRQKDLSRQNLMEIIEADAQLTTFCKALKQTGRDEWLRSGQTYTAWAPTDEGLADLNLNDQAAVERMVLNHLARFSNPTSTAGSIVMLNGKSMRYNSPAAFNGADIADANIAATNGLLHKLKAPIPYQYNIRELMDADGRFAQLAAFVARFDRKVYDDKHSTAYDSVFADYNALLQDARYGIGHLGCEDSLYTMILPSDAAWQAELERIATAFTPYNADAGAVDSVKRVQAAQALLGGLTFRGIVDATADSLVTTTGQVIQPARPYLQGYERIDASNGVVYVATEALNRNDRCVWRHVLQTEAEDLDSRTAMAGSNCYVRNTNANSLVQGVSENSYLEVASGNMDGGTTFYIADALATAYDVYVDFVNPVVDGTNMATERTKVTFQLMFTGANGRATAKNQNTPTEITGVDDKGERLPDIVSIKAFEAVQLPVSDVHDGMWRVEPEHAGLDIAPTTSLKVQTRVSATDARNGYVRKFRIDRIRLVPVGVDDESGRPARSDAPRKQLEERNTKTR